MVGDPPDMVIGALVSSALASHGWTQSELARRVGVSQQTVSNWKNGKLPMPEEAVRLAVALGVDPLTLLGKLWPAIAEADPVPAELRRLLAGATERQRRAVLAEARRIIGSGRRLRVADSVHQDIPAAAADARGPVRRGPRAARPQPPPEEDPQT